MTLWTHSAAHDFLAAAVPSYEHILLHMPSWQLLSPPMNTFSSTWLPGSCCPLLRTHSAAHAILEAVVPSYEHILLHMPSWQLLSPPMNTFCCTCLPGSYCPLLRTFSSTCLPGSCCTQLWTHSPPHDFLVAAVPSYEHILLHMPSWKLLSPPTNTFSSTCLPGSYCPLLWTHSPPHYFLAAAVLFSLHVCVHTWPTLTLFVAQSALNFLRQILLFYAHKMWHILTTKCIIFWRPH